VETDLFAGLPVSDLGRALDWYPRLLGDLEWFDPDDTERVWTLAEHRYLYAVLHPERAGQALVTLFVDDLDGFVAAAAARGLEPTTRETYDNGVRKITYHDPDGNEIGVGGGPANA
jgi:catechol 2,3-dioxygenase-like lactoylglutathione lyase family enzyme